MLSKILEHYMDDMQYMSGNEAEAHVRGCIEKLHSRCGIIFTANDHPSMRLRIDVCGIHQNSDGFVVVPVEVHNPDGFGFEEWTLWGKFAPTELFMILQPLVVMGPIPTRAMFDDLDDGGDGLASDERDIAAMVAAELDQIDQLLQKAHNTTPTHRIWLDDELWETTTDTQKAFEFFRKYTSEKCDDTYSPESVRLETIHHMDAE